jgi:hypothetical protein
MKSRKTSVVSLGFAQTKPNPSTLKFYILARKRLEF